MNLSGRRTLFILLGALLLALPAASAWGDDGDPVVLDLRTRASGENNLVVFCTMDGAVDHAFVVLSRQPSDASQPTVRAFGLTPEPAIADIPVAYVGPLALDRIDDVLRGRAAWSVQRLVCQIDDRVAAAASKLEASYRARARVSLTSWDAVLFLRELAELLGLSVKDNEETTARQVILRLIGDNDQEMFGGRLAVPAPATPPELDALDLPRVGTLGTAPWGAGAVVVTARADGTLSLEDGKPLTVLGLRDALVRRTADPETRDEDGSSQMNLVVNAEAALPWRIVQWILQVGADPRIGIHEVFLGARPLEGDARGALRCQLPRDHCISHSRIHEEIPLVNVRALRIDGEGSDPDALFALLSKMRRAWGGNPAIALSLGAPPPTGGSVPTAYMLRVLDIARRVGIERLALEGAMPPTEGEFESVEGLRKLVAELKTQDGALTLVVEDHRVPPRASAALPAPRGLLREIHGFSAWELLGDLGEVMERLTPRHVARAKDDPASRAVEEALLWLAAHQSPEGGWKAEGPNGMGKALYDPGVTGLALSAFLGAGYTSRGDHAFAKPVGKGLRYLKKIQDAEGCFGPRTSQHFVYNHATAALAMVEAYGMTWSPIFKASAQRALDFIALARNPYFAWRYGVKPGDNDTAVTGWMLTVLFTAKEINEEAVRRGRAPPFVIDEAAFDGAAAWLDKMTDPKTGRVGYIQRGGGVARTQELIDRFPPEKSEAMTAIGAWARTLLGTWPKHRLFAPRSVQRLTDLPPQWDVKSGSIDMIYWYFGTLAMHQVGKSASRTWNRHLLGALLKNQRKDTTHDVYRGSWDPAGPWGPDGGRVYATAILALCLETATRPPRVLVR